MFRRKMATAVLLSALVTPTFTFGQTTGRAAAAAPVKVDESIAKIRDEGMNRSQAMNTMRYLTDVIGARLTNSPAQKRANQWTREQFQKWGLQNAVVESWGEFGRGWELKRFTASIITPEYQPFRAYPKAWSPSTPGAITGDVVYVDATDEAGLEKYKGQLKGKIILQAPPRDIKPGFEPDATRNTAEALEKLASATPTVAQPPQQPSQQVLAQIQFGARKFRFYHDEGAAVIIEPSQTEDGTIRVMGAAVPVQPNQTNPFGGIPARAKNAPQIIPQLVAEAEQYNRLYRLVRQNIPVRMTVDLAVQFFDDDLNGYNTIAEIPGTDPQLKDEVVMIGAHMDSWHSGTGATDNGAGTTVVMEAMRIIQAAGLKPRRTIRVGLWTGEEQGLLGSRGYVAKHLATLGDNSDAAASGAAAGNQRRLTKKPGYDKFSAYYNLDNGTGRIRGVYMQGNEALRPIFRNWLAPFADMGAGTLTINGTGGTDHLAFDAIGLPGFQFIQDPIEYFSRTWHTTQDVSDRTIEEDLKQASIIMATFAYNTAMANEKLPRKQMPNLNIASLFKGVDTLAEFEEAAFRNSNLGFSICGHPVEFNQLPANFPSFLALNLHNHDAHGE
ncbi:MAG: M20/M25/M40 family metallo-hydrolase [Acidobacteriota bacterium]|nr:M20/M25/M40 family metallo-hydrolase [Acidobacteriota bacterium]